MKVNLSKICYGRSGDKGRNSNIGLIFINNCVYNWALINITEELVKEYMSSIVKGNVVRFQLDNLMSLNFILHDSLGGGASDALINDAQGKTHAQTLLTMKIEIPDNLLKEI